MIRVSTDADDTKRKLNNLKDEIERTVPSVLDVAGAFLEKEMVAKIEMRLQPPLKDATVRRKGSDTPLFDTGELLGQITHAMEDESTVEVGVFGSRAPIAKHHEFGAPKANIPERSFLRTAFAENERKIKKIVKGEMRK